MCLCHEELPQQNPLSYTAPSAFLRFFSEAIGSLWPQGTGSFAQKMSFIDLLVAGVSKLFLKLPRELLVNKRVPSSVGLLGGHQLHQQTGIQSLTSSPNCGH